MGFDAVVGNPPYIPIDSFHENFRDHLKKIYPIFERKYETSAVFIKLGLGIVNKYGISSYISPLTWQTGENYLQFRKYLILEKGIKRIINLPFDVFEEKNPKSPK